MAKGPHARERHRQKKLDRRRRKKKLERNKASLAKQPTPKLAPEIHEAYHLIDAQRYGDAEQLLDRLDREHRRCPAIVEAKIYLYQATGDHEGCCQAAKQLMQLTPRDPDPRLMYAQESMFCGRLGIALTNYRLFLKRWPDNVNAYKAENAIELIEAECETKIQSMGFGDASVEHGLELLVMHDEVLECTQNCKFEEAAEKCLALVKQAPDCIPARNNLVIAYFQSGNIEQAVHVAEETCRLAPDNRFAEATLGKLRFLCGHEDDANAIADRIVVNPPKMQDPLVAANELLGLLGRDEDIIVLSELAKDIDPRCQAVVLHHLAVAQCRLGDEKAARTSWKECLQELPTYADARNNLDDLNSGEGHAPWPAPFGKWIPRPVIDRMLDRSRARDGKQLDLSKDFPMVAALVPALLDRGDPSGRQLAMKLAQSDGSPAMLDALQEFAFGSRGPDAMRHEALRTLQQKGRVDAGPHRFYSRGKWTDIKLFMAEIHWNATQEAIPWVQEMSEIGNTAMNNGDYALAEETFQQILDEHPDNCSAAHNLCVVWMQRDGAAGRRRARTRLEEIHKQFPDYHFAALTLAQLIVLEDGDMDRAKALMEPILDAGKLHVSEAMALFVAQVQLAVKARDLDSAEKSLATLIQIVGEDAPTVAKLRTLIDDAAGPPRLSRMLPSWL